MMTPHVRHGEAKKVNMPTVLLWYTERSILGLDLKDPAILGLKAC